MKQIFSYQLSRFGGHAHFIGNSICFILVWNLVLIWMLPTQFALELRCIQRISLCFISFVDCLNNTLNEGDLLVVITSKAVCMLYQIGSFKTIKLYLTHVFPNLVIRSESQYETHVYSCIEIYELLSWWYLNHTCDIIRVSKAVVRNIRSWKVSCNAEHWFRGKWIFFWVQKCMMFVGSCFNHLIWVSIGA